jgi:hypothetical protein
MFGQALIDGSTGSADTVVGKTIPTADNIPVATSAEDKATDNIFFIFNLLFTIL